MASKSGPAAFALCAASLFALLLLSGCAAANGEPPKAVWAAGWGWENLSAVALAVMALLLGLSYMVATFLNDEQLKAWTKREIGQIGYSAIILVVVILVVGNLDFWLKVISLASPSSAWGDYVSKIVCCDPAKASCIEGPALAHGKPCHIALADDYLQTLYDSARHQAQSTNVLNYGLYSFLSNIGIGSRIEAFMDLANWSVRPLAGLSINAEFYSILFDLSFKTMLFIRVQQFFLEYVWSGFFPIMISMGLILRAFHFSRKLGGLLLALGLAVYVVLPMFYVLSDAILMGFVGPWVAAPGYENARLFGNSLDPTKTVVPGIGPDNPLDANEKTINEKLKNPANLLDMCSPEKTPDADVSQAGFMVDAIGKQWDKLEHSNWAVAEKSTDLDAFGRFSPDGPVGTLAMLMVFTLVMPFIALMTMLAAFKYLSPLLGGDVEISLLSRLI